MGITKTQAYITHIVKTASFSYSTLGLFENFCFTLMITAT